MSRTAELLVILNTTNLQQKDNRLYQVIKDLITNLISAESSIAAINSASSGAGFVTTSGGTLDTISMFTAAKNIEDVTADGISNALDLL